MEHNTKILTYFTMQYPRSIISIHENITSQNPPKKVAQLGLYCAQEREITNEESYNPSVTIKQQIN